MAKVQRGSQGGTMNLGISHRRMRTGVAASFALLLCQLLMPFSHATTGYAESRSPAQEAAPDKGNTRPLDDILRYVSSAWDDLTRSTSDCKALADPKTGGEPVLYLPAGMTIPPSLSNLQKQCQVRIEHLPAKISKLASMNSGVPAEGLLYLEHPYVVPGGQFNEMYGWDSYFILRGLLRQDRLALAKGMVENFFFEIENYGGVLNANRTYYLSRSQPPFLSSMILAVYDAEKAKGQADTQWLARAYGFAVRDYDQWNEPPHLAGSTGLSRYFDLADGPVPEIQGDPSHYYRGVAQFFFIHRSQYEKYLVPADSGRPNGPAYDVSLCDSRTIQTNSTDCGDAKVLLSADFYRGDRAMRESGFDVSFRFGPFGAETHHYAPVCLNSLLFKTETDLERMGTLLGRKEDALRWHQRAQARRKQIDHFLWNEDRGLYFDYDFVRGAQSSYEYASTFYPLWAGLASVRQAQMVERNLGLFEQPGGLAVSRRETEAQWDYPYGWAPIELLAVEGLRRYGYNQDVDRVSGEFLSTVLRNFMRDRTIREKYDVVTMSEDTRIDFGYSENFTGFGWTNGVFLELLNDISPGKRALLGGR
jgi:alpha,alpha-trehalase